MSDLTHLIVSTDYVDTPKADDFVHADLLKRAVNDEIVCCINEIVDRLNILTGTDNKLKDSSVLLRMLAAEVKEVLPGITYFWQARLATTANIILAGAQTVDGSITLDGDIILVKDQVDATQNGLYAASTGVWQRLDPAVDGWSPDGVSHVWVSDGDDNSFASWIWAPEDGDEVGTADIDWVLYFATLKPTLDADVLDALQGTEGTPDNANRFVTDSDPRLSVFQDLQDGLVPQPGASTSCVRFLCEDGTWAIPDASAVAAAMQVNVTNNMTGDGFIVFPGTRGVQGLDTPTDDGDAANKLYVDDIADGIFISLAPIVAWKVDLDALDGIIQCDGAGSYGVATDPTFATANILGKLTVGGLIDPTGLQLTPVGGNPGNPFTLWVDSGPGDLWLGPGNITGSIVANAGAAAAAQGTADAAKAVTDILDTLAGILLGDGAGGYSAIAIPGGAVNFLREDGVFTAVPGTAPPSRGECHGAPAPLALTGPGTWDQILVPTAGLLNNMTFVGNGLRADQIMSVTVICCLSGDITAGVGAAVDFGIAVNGAPAGIVVKSVQRQFSAGLGVQPNESTICCELDLAANDVVTLWAQQVAGSSTFTFVNVNLIVKE